MSSGWIKLHRQIQDNPIWNSEPFTRGQAWIDLLLLANHQSGIVHRRGVRVTVRRGEIAHSYETLSRRWRWSKGKVQRFMNELKTDRQIHLRMGTENVSVTALIVITNYEKYQGGDTETDTQTEPETGTEQECKEEKRKKKSCASVIKYKLGDGTELKLAQFFEKLWAVYPKKDGKKQAMRHYFATVKNEDDMERINLALGNYLDHIEKTGTKPQYIKNGSTWFNNWTDWEQQE